MVICAVAGVSCARAALALSAGRDGTVRYWSLSGRRLIRTMTGHRRWVQAVRFLDDVIERRDRFANELIIASHFSTRYHSNQIRHYVKDALPDMLDGRMHLWI